MRLGAVMPGQPGISIGCDNHAGGRMAAEHLMARGRRRIAFIGDASPHAPEFLARYQGGRDAQADAGIAVDPELQVDAENSPESGHAAMHALLSTGIAFDAVFAASDLIAFGAIKALASHGLRVPQDVAVVGFDGLPISGYFTPSLTTVVQDTAAAGEALVEALLGQIHGEPVASRMLLPRLVVRASSDA